MYLFKLTHQSPPKTPLSCCKMYLLKFQNVFVQIAKCICSNCQMYLFKLLNVFVQIAKYICSKHDHDVAHMSVARYNSV